MSVDGYVIRGPGGTISVTPAALQRLVVGAAESVDGARLRRPRRALSLVIAGRRVEVSLELAARRGTVLPELGRAVQQRIADELRTACDLDVGRIDVAIEEVE
jgi:uncharacterized alkaline shock family protein YloU